MSEQTSVPASVTLRVVRGNPTPEEIAALVAVVRLRSAATALPAPARPRSAWSDPATLLRAPLPRRWR
jgi:Acyl-CoA carboxylase epsilon subunit